MVAALDGGDSATSSEGCVCDGVTLLVLTPLAASEIGVAILSACDSRGKRSVACDAIQTAPPSANTAAPTPMATLPVGRSLCNFAYCGSRSLRMLIVPLWDRTHMYMG